MPGAGVEPLHAAARQPEADAWLCRLPEAEVEPPPATPPARRASHRGFLPLSVDDYWQLLDGTGRQVRAGQRGAIPHHLAPILARLQINAEHWLASVSRFGRIFHHAAGRAESLLAHAHRLGRRSLHGITHSRAAFG